MKQRNIGFLLSAIAVSGLCIGVYGQEAQPVKGKHALWRISSGRNSVYLLGSIHLLKKENYPLPEVIERAFEESETAVFEVDLGEMAKPEKQRMIISKAFLREGKSLEERLSRKTYDKLVKKAGEIGVSVLAFDRLKPWYIAIALSMERMMGLGFMPEYGVDRHYYGKAVKAGKKVVGLETSEYQLDLFNKLSDENQDKLLSQVIDDLEVVEKELKVMVKAWTDGDLKTLDETMLKSFKEYPEIYEAFLTTRNRNWMTEIEKFLAGTAKHFIVVGAAHMVGKDSLIDMLEKKGYTVEQL